MLLPFVRLCKGSLYLIPHHCRVSSRARSALEIQQRQDPTRMGATPESGDEWRERLVGLLLSSNIL